MPLQPAAREILCQGVPVLAGEVPAGPPCWYSLCALRPAAKPVQLEHIHHSFTGGPVCHLNRLQRQVPVL